MDYKFYGSLHPDSLRHASAISILLAVLFVVICSMMAIHAMWKGKTQKLRLVPDFALGVSFSDLFTTIPVFATAFGCHVNGKRYFSHYLTSLLLCYFRSIPFYLFTSDELIHSLRLYWFAVHPVRAELGRPSDMTSAVRISLILCVAIYFAVGFFGYLLFGDLIMADMLVNFDQASDSLIGTVLNDIVRLSYAIHLMLVFPVMNYSLRVNVDELFFPKRPLLSTETLRFFSLTCILLAFIYGGAVAFPNIWYFFQFMGTTTVMCIMFIFPSSIVLRYELLPILVSY